MSRRGDNIHKRKDGRWEGRYPKGRKENGKLIYGSVYGKTYKEVKEKLSTANQMTEDTISLKKKDMSFAELLDLWLANNRTRLKRSTVTKYQNLISLHILPELGCIPICKLDVTRINLFLEQKLTKGKSGGLSGLAPSYVRSITLIINAALNYATKEELLQPLKTKICKPHVPKNELMILSIEEQKQLEKSLLDNFSTTSGGILLALHTGLRIGEICALSWDDIDLKRRVITVRHTVARVKNDTSTKDTSTILILDSPKTKASAREIPISDTLLPILMRLHTISCEGFVLTGTQTFIQPRTLEYRFHKILRDCSIQDVNFHALRHTFATRCVEAGVDIKSLSEILGHGNVSVTLNTYVHSSLEMKRAQLEKLSSLSA